MKKYLIILITILAFGAATASAQSIWATAEAKYGIIRGLSANVEAEYRTLNKLKGTDRWTAGVGLDYKVCPYFKVGASYKFIYRHVEERLTNKGNIVEDYWQPRNRFQFSLTGLYKWNRFTFSLRERYQFTHHKSMYVAKYDGDTGKPKKDEYISGKNKNILRSRIKIDYSIKKTGFTPYISAEMYNNFRNFRYVKTRYTAGTEFKINKHNSVEAFYRYIDHHDADDEAAGHIIGLGYQFKF